MRLVPLEPCLALIHEFEGDRGHFHVTRALDPADNYEIGWSHKLTGPDDPLWFARLSEDEADALAIEDLNKAAAGVCEALGASVDDLTDNEYAAVIDFTYNLGVHRFETSTLCHFLTHGNLALAVDEFPKWDKARVNGTLTVLPGLARRRAAEVAVWRTPPSA